MILATCITVECDRCKNVETFVSEADHERFDNDWFHDLVSEYCPDCRVIIADKLDAQAITQNEILNQIF